MAVKKDHSSSPKSESRSNRRRERHRFIPQDAFSFSNDRYYCTSEVLGRGTFGEVRLGVAPPNRPVAVKILSKAALEPRDLLRVRSEISALRRLKNKNYVLQMEHYHETDDLIFIVTECAANGTLQNLVNSKGPLVESDARRLFWQMVSAVDACHQHNVVHHDITPTNILLTDGWHIRLADFGLCSLVSSPNAQINEFGSTPLFAAPELLARRPHDRSVDMYGLGMVLYVLLHGDVPYPDVSTIDELYDAVLGPADPKAEQPKPDPASKVHPRVKLVRRADQASELTFADDISQPSIDLLRGLLHRDPARRTKLWQVLRHPWLSADPTVNGSSFAAPAIGLATNGDEEGDNAAAVVAINDDNSVAVSCETAADGVENLCSGNNSDVHALVGQILAATSAVDENMASLRGVSPVIFGSSASSSRGAGPAVVSPTPPPIDSSPAPPDGSVLTTLPLTRSESRRLRRLQTASPSAVNQLRPRNTSLPRKSGGSCILTSGSLRRKARKPSPSQTISLRGSA